MCIITMSTTYLHSPLENDFLEYESYVGLDPYKKPKIHIDPLEHP